MRMCVSMPGSPPEVGFCRDAGFVHSIRVMSHVARMGVPSTRNMVYVATGNNPGP